MPKRTQGAGSDRAGETDAPRPDRREVARTNRITAMSHPLRARILRVLFEREVMSPAELSRQLHAKLSDVSYHVRALVKLGCAEEVGTRPVRGALEHFYRAIERPLIDTDEFEDLDPLVAEDLLCQAVQRILDDLLTHAKRKWWATTKTFTSPEPP